MKCEQVFDVLTRGPFPTGQRTDDQVEVHLARCHECRQLAEALRPATDLLHESLSGSSAESLPGYTGTLERQTSHDLSAAVTLMLDEASVQEPQAVPKRKSEARRPPSKSWAAGVLCTAAVGLLVAGISAVAMGQREFEILVDEDQVAGDEDEEDVFEDVTANTDDDDTVADEDPLSEDVEEGPADLEIDPDEGVTVTDVDEESLGVGTAVSDTA